MPSLRGMRSTGWLRCFGLVASMPFSSASVESSAASDRRAGENRGGSRLSPPRSEGDSGERPIAERGGLNVGHLSTGTATRRRHCDFAHLRWSDALAGPPRHGFGHGGGRDGPRGGPAGRRPLLALGAAEGRSVAETREPGGPLRSPRFVRLLSSVVPDAPAFRSWIPRRRQVRLKHSPRNGSRGGMSVFRATPMLVVVTTLLRWRARKQGDWRRRAESRQRRGNLEQVDRGAAVAEDRRHAAVGPRPRFAVHELRAARAAWTCRIAPRSMCRRTLCWISTRPSGVWPRMISSLTACVTNSKLNWTSPYWTTLSVPSRGQEDLAVAGLLACCSGAHERRPGSDETPPS